MKAIIGGKRYNTETARLLAKHYPGMPRTNYNWYEEGVYLTPGGRLFLAGEGHAASPYAQSGGEVGRWTPGERITPLTQEEALGWLEAIGEEFPDLEAYLDAHIEEA